MERGRIDSAFGKRSRCDAAFGMKRLLNGQSIAADENPARAASAKTSSGSPCPPNRGIEPKQKNAEADSAAVARPSPEEGKASYSFCDLKLQEVTNRGVSFRK